MLEGLSPQTLIGAVVVGLAGLALVVFRFKAAIFVFGAMLMASALGAPTDWLGRPVQTWLIPIQARRSEIYAACGALLLAGVVFHLSQVRMSRVGMQGILLVAIGFYGAFVRATGGELTSAAESAAFAFLTLVPAVIILPSIIHDREDAMKILRVVGVVSILWIAACVVQFVIRRKVLTLGGGYTRFNGMLSNPQHAAVLLAFFLTTTAFLMVNDLKARYRPIWAAVSAMNLALLFWTASRTGVGMAIIGLTAVFYSRLGRSILLLPIAGLVLAGALSILKSTGTLQLERLTSTDDTRSRAWQGLWQEFLEFPLFGKASIAERATYSENSILIALAGFGIFMGVLVGILLLVSIYKSYTVFRARFALKDPTDKRLADLAVGLNGMYIAGAMFEGYMLSRVSSPVSFLLIAAALGAWTEHVARDNTHADAPQAPATPEDADDSDWSDAGDFSDYGEEPRT